MQGTLFGKYQLIELLGRGGMGEVWRAHDTAMDRTVAIKILPAEISQDEVFQQRFRREAHAAARLRNPHVVPIHTHGEVDGRLYVDMALIEGRDLQSILERGPLPPARAVHIVEQIAKALNAAHKAGLLHRDVKPSNILLDDDDFAYLIDFGLALAAGERGLTTIGDVIGTFHYMAPERFSTRQVNAPPIDARSDIYALTCVLYECLTAEHAFPGDSLEQQVGNHLYTPPPRPSRTKPGLPTAFDAVIAKGMAKKPDERYGTALELARAARDAITTPIAVPQRPDRTQPTAPDHTMPRPRVENYGRRPTPEPQNGPNTETVAHRLPPADSYPRQQSPLPRQESPPPRQEPPVPKQKPPRQLQTPAPKAPWWRRPPVVISAAAVLTVALVVVATVIILGKHGSGQGGVEQTTLPFSGLREPEGVSVDNGGTVYVADTLHNRVLSLPMGSTNPAVLPFEGLNYPTGVTADNTGNVYVTDSGNKRVLVLQGGSIKELPFTDLVNPTGVTVDNSRTVYVTDTAKNRVVYLPAGAGPEGQKDLPFTGLNAPTGVVVNENNGTVYVADGGNNRVLSLPAGSSTQAALPFAGLTDPGGVTVDDEGAVYVTNSGDNRTLKLPVGATSQVVLPFTGLDYPWGLAVDNNGTVYVAGHNNKVVALRQK
ncbi:protein kinase [Mycobacterium fragae]|uniref:non-specific serine/threonine protein kinase n=1 Tax=Mycobacterium fragae TaxID=1260918 RepID=A0A1X1UKF1_9MYCO|nr:serine/threonine-protein kinase PknD [Mycobacterium fragae]MCV7401147.1 protein kinase [Mycobacterium fragae]ORV57262.1 serine/threonine protein kinase [Mycobacterium fragae]